MANEAFRRGMAEAGRRGTIAGTGKRESAKVSRIFELVSEIINHTPANEITTAMPFMALPASYRARLSGRYRGLGGMTGTDTIRNVILYDDKQSQIISRVAIGAVTALYLTGYKLRPVDRAGARSVFLTEKLGIATEHIRQIKPIQDQGASLEDSGPQSFPFDCFRPCNAVAGEGVAVWRRGAPNIVEVRSSLYDFINHGYGKGPSKFETALAERLAQLTTSSHPFNGIAPSDTR